MKRLLVLMMAVGLISSCGSNSDSGGEDSGSEETSGSSTLSLSSGFAQNCAGCHGASAQGGVGERLAGLDDSISEFRSAVRNGKSSGMPAFSESQYSDADLEADFKALSSQ